jgi:hypothetical protein
MTFARRPSMTEPTHRTFYTEGVIGSDWRVVGDSDVDLEDQLYFFLPRCPVCSDYLDDYSQTVQNRLYRLYEQLLEWEAQVIMHQIVREAFQGRLPSRGDFNGASSAPKAKLPFSVKIRLATPILFALLVLNNTYISLDCLHPLLVLLNHCRTLVGALPSSVKICLATPILFTLVLWEIRRSVSRAGSR